jgi:hypothetical protein
MKSSSRSYDFLWLSIALLPLISISFLLALRPQDYWWVLRVGQETLHSGAVPVKDTFSLSQFGHPIVYQSWLSGVLFWLVYNLGGTPLTFLLRGILIGVTYSLLWYMARAFIQARLATLLIIVLGLASANNWSIRSQLFAYPLFIICLLTLFAWQNGNRKYLWLLPAATLLWANLHGSFVLPIILAGTALIFGKGERKPLLIIFGLMLVATLINPRGAGVWEYVVSMLNSPSDQLYSFEWAPPRNAGWQMNIFFAWTMALGPLAAFSPRKLSAMEWIWFLGFGWQALSGLRYVIWFLFIVAILTAKFISAWTKQPDPQGQIHPAFNISLGILILTFALLFLPGIRQRWMGDSVRIYELETTPLAATEWLAQHPELPGPLWADYAFGGYMSFALQSRRPWMGSRFFAFPPQQWAEYVQVSRAENWQEMFDRAHINLLMLSTKSQPKLVKAVSASALWCAQYHDEYAVIFSRCRPIQ